MPDHTKARLDEIRRAHLLRANEIRLAQSVAKRALREGKRRLDDVLTDPRSRSFKVGTLIRSTPGIGRIKTERAMRDLRLRSTTRVRDLSLERVTQVLRYLREQYPQVPTLRLRAARKYANVVSATDQELSTDDRQEYSVSAGRRHEADQDKAGHTAECVLIEQGQGHVRS